MARNNYEIGGLGTLRAESVDSDAVEIQAWEQQPGERPLEFYAFQHYRDQGPRRTFEETSQWLELSRLTDAHHRLRSRYVAMRKEPPAHLDPEELNWLLMQRKKKKSVKSKNTFMHESSYFRVYKWAKERNWRGRVLLYDRWLDKVKLDTAKQEVEEMVKRHLSISGMLQSKAATRLKTMEPEELSAKNLLDFLTEGVKLERLTREMSTENTKVQGDSENPLVLEHASAAKDILRTKLNQIAERRAQSDKALEEARALPALTTGNEREYDPEGDFEDQ